MKRIKWIGLVVVVLLLTYSTIALAGWGSRTINIFRVGNCEYIEVINSSEHYAVVHKGDCTNPKHKY
jgi:hypothetical protein